jgi:hypothetical protein
MLTRGRAANHLYLQVVGDGDPHTLIRPDTVAPRTPTETLQQSSLVTTHRPQPPRCCANLATQLRGCSTPFSATPTGSMSRPSSWLAARLFRCSIAKPTRSSPRSPASRRGQPYEHTCSPWRRRPGSTHSSTCRRPPPDENSTPRKTWPLYSTGGFRRHPLTLDRYLGFPAFRMPFMIITFGVNTWRSGRSSLSASQIRSETAPA